MALSEDEFLRAKSRAAVLKSLAHPTRVFIVDLIDREGPHCVCDLAARVGVDVSTVSRHLAILRNAGILRDRKEGTTVLYSLSCECIGSFMSVLENVLMAKYRDDQKAYSAVIAATESQA